MGSTYESEIRGETRGIKEVTTIEKVTFASVIILDRHESLYVLGIDLARIVDDDLITYDTIALTLSKDDYHSINQVLQRIFYEVFQVIPEDEDGVCFRGKIKYFRHNYHRLTRKAGIYAAGRSVSFRYLNANPSRAVKIAVEAVSNNERERLNGGSKDNL